MKFTAFRTLIHEHKGTLLLAVLILLLGLGLILARPTPPALAENVNSRELSPVASLTSTNPPPLTATLTPTSSPTHTPTPAPSLTSTWTPTQTATDLSPPTLTPRPVYLVWAPEGSGGNLREGPNGRIMALVPNGRWVESLGQVEKDGGLFWMRVQPHFEAQVQTGWIAKILLYQVPAGELLQVQAAEGVYLRANPQGNIRTWLGDGSPVIKLDIQNEWTQVRTLDGTEGWILSRLLIPYIIER